MVNMLSDEWGVIILAAGRGARMKDGQQKVLKDLDGKPIISWILQVLTTLGMQNIVVVVGYKANEVEDKLASYPVTYAYQKELKGTANAVEVGLKKLAPRASKVLVIFGDDSALFSEQTILGLTTAFSTSGGPGTILVTKLHEPTELGGLYRDDKGNLAGVMFMSKLVELGVKEYEILCGAMCFDRKWLEENLPRITPSRVTGEYPLPWLIEVAANRKEYLQTFLLSNPAEWASVNTPEELAAMRALKGNSKHAGDNG